MSANRSVSIWLSIPIAGFLLLTNQPAFGQQLRIVSWNTANDVSNTGGDTHPPAIGGPAQAVFQAIGAFSVTAAVPARPIDILALQESAINSGSGVNPTAQAYANILNQIYYPGQPAVYLATPGGTTDGTSTGNGPNTLVYNSKTVTLVSQMGIGAVSGTGPARQPLQFEFQPVGYSSNSAFYLYDDHFKSGTTSSDNTRRGAEATIVTNSINSLPANTPIVFAGDYNPTNNTSDLGYNGVVTGSATNHGIDPLNPTNQTQTWNANTQASRNFSTDAPSTSAFFTGQGTTGMEFRDDMLLNSPGMLSGNPIEYIAGSFAAFGNTATFDALGNPIKLSTHTYQGAITTTSTSPTNPNNFQSELSGQYTATQAAAILTDLTEAADHLPVVADYEITGVPEPSSLVLGALGAAGIGYVRRRRNPRIAS